MVSAGGKPTVLRESVGDRTSKQRGEEVGGVAEEVASCSRIPRPAG
jgi:hypothetical protein